MSAQKPLLITGYDAEFADIFWQEWLPGFSAFLAPHFELRVIRFDDTFGTFGSALYDASCRKMIAATLEELTANDGRIVIMADCDMKIFRDFWPDIREAVESPDFNMATAMDRLGGEHFHCGGFIVVRSNAVTRRFFEDWLEACDAPDIGSVQNPLNTLIAKCGFRVDQLSENIIWTVGLSPELECVPWRAGDVVPTPPVGMAVHHANFTIGAKNKRALMAAVSLKRQP